MSKGAKVESWDLPDLIQALEDASAGRWFEVEFEKRTTGELRRITCRTGVKRHLKGGSAAYNFESHGLLCVWLPEECRRNDGKDNGYRAIPVDGIRSLSAAGRKFVVSEGLAYEIEGPDSRKSDPRVRR